MTKSGKLSHPNWTQLSILTLTWSREMYGLEMQKYLELRGRKLSTGRLYTNLKNIEELGWVTTREEERAGVKRRYYVTSQKGKEAVQAYIEQFLLLFQDVFTERLRPLMEMVHQFYQWKPGDVIIDFSALPWEYLIQLIAKSVAPIGRYFVACNNSEIFPLISARVSHHELQNIVTLIPIEKHKIDIPKESADFILVMMTLHEDGTEWILDEIQRLLKKSGKALIIDPIELDDNLVLDAFVELLARHSYLGLNEQRFIQQVEQRDLIIVNNQKIKGVHFIELQLKLTK
ncbi:MAG: PadR family transcriptional regulator [Candidatus Heimdallarchaeota archaeon]|nr:PadR family transcriptional regulator [Candidatus Heimdallarchaeota archaeon]